MGMILQDAQNQTPFVGLGRIDADLDVEVTPLTALGRPSRAKNPKHFKVEQRRTPVARGILIVMARMNPGSRYNKITGGRWAIPASKLPTGPGTAEARQTIIGQILSKMTLVRHSSSKFLKSGFKAARNECVSSPLFKNRYRKVSGTMNDNRLNTMDARELGRIETTLPSGNTFQITGYNNVGEGGNAVLDAKHRAALIAYASGPLEDAVRREESVQVAEFEKRMAAQLEKINRRLA
jgi:hypothetical protein